MILTIRVILQRVSQWNRETDLAETLFQRRKILADKASQALEEAWIKANGLLAQSKGQPAPEVDVRLAAEAVEYSCALFSLAFDLQDFDPPVNIVKNVDLTKRIADSVEHLRKARELKGDATKDAYTSLRIAADDLKIAYLEQTKKSPKRSR